MENGARVLLVEDEPRVVDFIVRSLEEEGFLVRHASQFDQAIRDIGDFAPHLIILDLMIPGGSGLDLLRRLRSEGNDVPVLVLSAKSSMQERVTGLDAGADDYLPKPFGIEELLARLRVLLRRKSGPLQNVIQCGDLVVDVGGRRVTRGERVVFLSDTEFRLLEFLALQRGETASKRQLLDYVWDDPQRDDNIVEVYIRYLRTKLERGQATRLIHTVRGKGYILSESPSED